MNKSRLISIFVGALVPLAGCTKHVTPAVNVEACSLLTNDEVASIQGTTISANKGSSSSGGGMLVSQCVYGSTEPNKSVGIALSEVDQNSPSRREPNSFWDETFARFRKTEKEAEGETESERRKKESLREKRGEEREDEVIPPTKIEGVGDEAFWSPTRVGGALYVLKRSRDAFLRISVGGPGSEQEKIEKSKKLALKALPRL
jgi:hypothetical protein